MTTLCACVWLCCGGSLCDDGVTFALALCQCEVKRQGIIGIALRDLRISRSLLVELVRRQSIFRTLGQTLLIGSIIKERGTSVIHQYINMEK